MEPTPWHFLLVPLIFLPIMLLFWFTGCIGDDPAPVQGTTPPPTTTPPTTPPPVVTPPTPSVDNPPDYARYILGETPPGKVKHPVSVDGGAVIGYWRLVEASLEADTARDEKGQRPGSYVQGTALNNVAPVPNLGGSEAAPGSFLPSPAGLIASDPSAIGRTYQGAYVRIPYTPGLHTAEFTIEAWVNFPAIKPDYEHVLFDTGGLYAAAGLTAHRGYRLFADRTGAWQVRLFTDYTVLAFATPPGPPLVPKAGRTHIAMVMRNGGGGGTQKELLLFIDGKEAAKSTIASYEPPLNAPLFIGVENVASDPSAPIDLRAPLLAQVQEVVLHGKPLSREEIENHVDINRPKV